MPLSQQHALFREVDPSGRSLLGPFGISLHFYYQPGGENAHTLKLMRLFDEEFTNHDFKTVRDLRGYLHPADQALVSQTTLIVHFFRRCRGRAAIAAARGRWHSPVMVPGPASGGGQGYL